MTKVASKQKMEFYVYNKDGKDYLGYNSHPLAQQTVMGIVWQMEKMTIRKNGMWTDRDSSSLYGVSLSRR